MTIIDDQQSKKNNINISFFCRILERISPKEVHRFIFRYSHDRNEP